MLARTSRAVSYGTDAEPLFTSDIVVPAVVMVISAEPLICPRLRKAGMDDISVPPTFSPNETSLPPFWSMLICQVTR